MKPPLPTSYSSCFLSFPLQGSLGASCYTAWRLWLRRRRRRPPSGKKGKKGSLHIQRNGCRRRRSISNIYPRPLLAPPTANVATAASVIPSKTPPPSSKAGEHRNKEGMRGGGAYPHPPPLLWVFEQARGEMEKLLPSSPSSPLW